VADETRRITYEGSPALVRELVQCLEHEGVEAHRPPRPREETHDIGDMSERVVVDLVVKGASTAIVVAVKKFRDRFKERVEIEGEDD
jgi:Holliday junction resolvase